MTYPSVLVSSGNVVSERNNDRQLNWLGRGIERAGIALDYADSALNTVGNTFLVASAVALFFDPEPFSKGGIAIGGGALGLSAKGIRSAVVGVKLGLDFLKVLDGYILVIKQQQQQPQF